MFISNKNLFSFLEAILSRVKIILIWFCFAAIFSAISTGCTTGAENKSDSNNNHETEKKSADDGY